jgi:hypothetical protein
MDFIQLIFYKLQIFFIPELVVKKTAYNDLYQKNADNKKIMDNLSRSKAQWA